MGSKQNCSSLSIVRALPWLDIKSQNNLQHSVALSIRSRRHCTINEENLRMPFKTNRKESVKSSSFFEVSGNNSGWSWFSKLLFRW
jgi:hypothetical protein